MELNADNQIDFLTDANQLCELTSVLREEKIIAVDTESDSRHRHPEKVCLVQIATSKKVYLIDTISIENLSGIGEALANNSIIKIMQGADYDIRCLDRQWGFRIRNIFDTSIAARFVGMDRFGLSALIETLLGIKIPKDARIQKSDWSERPLKPEALSYAATDVWYLPEIHEILKKQLSTLGRSDWVSEECSRLEQIRHTPPDPDTAFLSLKGTGKFNGQAKAILRRLYLLRDSEARRRNRPPHYVLPNESLIELALNPQSDFSKIPQLKNSPTNHFGMLLIKALREGLTDPPITISSLKHRKKKSMTPEETIRLQKLKEWRNDRATALNLEPGLVWPLISLERLARSPDSLDFERKSPEVRTWQRNQFLKELHLALPSIYKFSCL
jgi:ribonuclease D